MPRGRKPLPASPAGLRNELTAIARRLRALQARVDGSGKHMLAAAAASVDAAREHAPAQREEG